MGSYLHLAVACFQSLSCWRCDDARGRKRRKRKGKERKERGRHQSTFNNDFIRSLGRKKKKKKKKKRKKKGKKKKKM